MQNQYTRKISLLKVFNSLEILLIMVFFSFLLINIDNVEISKRIDFVLELGIVPLICDLLLKSDNDELLTECYDLLINLCCGTKTQVMIINFNEK